LIVPVVLLLRLVAKRFGVSDDRQFDARFTLFLAGRLLDEMRVAKLAGLFRLDCLEVKIDLAVLVRLRSRLAQVDDKVLGAVFFDNAGALQCGEIDTEFVVVHGVV
jgi:hypothetical protein